MDDYCRAKVYLQIEPRYNHVGNPIGFKVAKITQNRPTQPAGYPVVELEVTLPKHVLKPYYAHVVVEEENVRPIVEPVSQEDETHE